MNNREIITVLTKVSQAFEKLNIAYFVGGSIASSLYGVPRSTLDIDIISDMRLFHVRKLIELLKNEFYVDEEMILEAIENKSAFNLIHLETMIKVDVFVLKPLDFHINEFRRRRKESFTENTDIPEFYVASPEDMILAKLDWYKIGGQVSERQWNDLVGIIKVQKGVLDLEYLTGWAHKLGMSDLLEKAMRDAVS